MKVLFFGSLADIAGKTDFDLADVSDTEVLKQKLFGLHPTLSQHSFLVAVNKKISPEKMSLTNEDVVALLPPFSGG